MNSSELLIYSFLMRQRIPFTRHCHKAVSSGDQLKKAIGVNQGAFFVPGTDIYRNLTDRSYCLLVYDRENHAIENFKSEKLEKVTDPEELFSVLNCGENTFSPLSLIPSENVKFNIVYDVMILRYETVYLSPCSEKATVSMSVSDFTEKLFPALSEEISVI